MLAAMDAADAPSDPSRFDALRDRPRQRSHGRSPAALRFQAVTTVIDLLIIAFFILTPLLRENAAFLWIDYSVAVIMIAEIAARLLASTNMLRLLRQQSLRRGGGAQSGAQPGQNPAAIGNRHDRSLPLGYRRAKTRCANDLGDEMGLV